MTYTFGGVEFSKVHVAVKVKEGLNKFVRARLEAGKVRGRRGRGKKLSRGKDDLDIELG
jgi:hypothetical protein